MNHLLVVLLICFTLSCAIAWIASPTPAYRLGWAWRFLTTAVLFTIWMLFDYYSIRFFPGVS